MASVNSRNGNLYIDFRYEGKRRREQTTLEDTMVNRNRLSKLANKIETSIQAGTFEYEKFFAGQKKTTSVSRNMAIMSPQEPHQIVAETPSIKSFFEQWREEMAPTWRRTYIETIDTTFRCHVFPFFGEDKRVGDITKEDIYAFRAHLTKGRPGSKLVPSPSTVNRALKLLRMMLNEAADRFDFRSPFTGVKLLKERKSHIEPFSLEEVKLILKHVRKDMHNYFLVRFFTGVRSGEANGLKWKYIDFERRQILIRETFVNSEFEYTKNDGSQREIDMSGLVYDALRAQFDVTGKQECVFCLQNGKPLNNRNLVNRIWKPLLRYLELPYRRPYTMRHTAATLWLAAGENPEWIARQMGHSTTEMLFKVYSRYVPNLTRNDGSAFVQLLASNGFGGNQ